MKIPTPKVRIKTGISETPTLLLKVIIGIVTSEMLKVGNGMNETLTLLIKAKTETVISEATAAEARAIFLRF